MKQLLLLLTILSLLSLSLVACGEVVTAIAKETPFQLDTASCTLRAAFSAEDIDPVNGTLTFSVYEPDIYYRDELVNLQPGDEIFALGEWITVNSVSVSGDLVEINGGYFTGDNGVTFAPWRANTENTSRMFALLEDDYAYMSNLGTVKLPMANTLDFSRYLFVGDDLVDDAVNFPTTPEHFYEYAQDAEKDFDQPLCFDNPTATSLTLRDGIVTAIRVTYVP